MKSLADRLLPLAAAGALALAAAGLATPTAAALPWDHDSYRCDGDRCANFRCDWLDDRCVRISEWSWREGFHGRRTQEWCVGARCAVFRCDHDGDRCVRAGAWRWR